MAAAAEAMLMQDDISSDLRPGAFRASSISERETPTSSSRLGGRPSEIPNAEFVGLEGLDHLGAHFMSERIIPAVLRMLRGASGGPLSA